ncbi:DNA-directed DNA polymerase epsilon, subunit B [Ceratocystis pirilliformis]|uniref:DNA polymerase epsilon subunit B n=1 Tax=Ceratocystis pirilliformis TaxID=259994 RepID=A0ABR3ZA54_9PEZI
MRGFLAGKATPAKNQLPSSSIPSSSPFATPAHPLRPYTSSVPASTPTPDKHSILPIDLAPATLRSLAFRTFTKKHSLTLTSSALLELAIFIGRHCGSGWREEGLAEKVLEEVARSWKNRNGGIIVDGASKELKQILSTIEATMSGGRIIQGGKGLIRHNSLTLDSTIPENEVIKTRLGITVPTMARADSGLSTQEDLNEQDEAALNDVRKWLKIINAYEQPRLIYNVATKHFDIVTTKPSILPDASSKTAAFRHRYHVIHQRLMRNEAFQTSTVAAARSKAKGSLTTSAGQKITPIANLLGRHGSHHMLLGLIVVLAAGGVGISDLTGTITLDLAQTVSVPEDSAWYTPGMIVLVDGIYEEEEDVSTSGLHGARGIGGFIGGRFQAFFIGQPPCEKRSVTLGISGPEGNVDHAIGGGFGWTDFIGHGSERAVGAKMRRIQERIFRPMETSEARMRNKVVVLGEVNLNKPRTLEAVRKILSLYANDDSATAYPLAFVLTGSFTDGPIMARGGSGGSVEYKEYFDALAAVIGEFLPLMQNSSFIFVPGDNDGWISSVTAGASVPLPRKPVPEMFTSRLRRMFVAARNVNSTKAPPEVVWTTNPSRLSLFGPTHEVVLFRDDISARLRRSAISLKTDRDSLEETAIDKTSELEDEVPDLDDLMDGKAESATSKPTENQPAIVDDAATAAAGIKSSRKLVKTLCDQSYLSPFRPEIRPVHWEYALPLHLYPMPTAVILVDSTSNPFAVTYEGCHVLNPGTLLDPGRKDATRWAEYEVGRGGKFKECVFR